MRTVTLRAVAVRARWAAVRGTLGRRARRSVERAFDGLECALEQLETSTRARPSVEPKVRAYVGQLTRAVRAAERALAAEEQGDARVLAELRTTGEELDLRAEALAEAERVAEGGAR
jgi:hypothetical protein